MKKILISSGITVMMMGLVSVAFAAAGTISLSPATKAVTPGQLVTVAITANPSGGSVYTVKAKINFPANLLQVQSFAFSSGWLPLTQSGYDLIDNTNGVLIKTAGYAGGLSAPKTLGTITFKVKAAGVATVSVAGDSLMLDATNGNQFSTGSSSVLTSGATVTPTPRLTAAVTAPSPSASAVAASATPEPSVSPNNQTAAISTGLSAGRIALYGAIALVIIYLLWLVFRRKRTNGPTV